VGSSVPFATSVYDTATVLGPGAPVTPTGTVTYTFFANGTCSGTGTAAGSGALASGVPPNSTTQGPLNAGSYSFRAAYSGDANNAPLTSTCENFTVAQATPTIATSLSLSSVALGGSVSDSATLTGASANAGGTVTYTVYRNDSCTDLFADGGTVTVKDGVVPDSDPVRFPNTGTYWWQAAYSGDANNTPATGACTSEPLTVGKPTTAKLTTPTAELHLLKTASPKTANPGDNVSYTIKVTNTGQTPYTTTNPASFSDDLTNLLTDATYNHDAHATTGTLNHTTHTLKWSGPLPIGATATMTYTVTVKNPDPGPHTLTNTVEAPNSNCATGSTDPACTTTTPITTPTTPITTPETAKAPKSPVINKPHTPEAPKAPKSPVIKKPQPVTG
jgi:uncharacterized repeat protein (TIGR01451 family)